MRTKDPRAQLAEDRRRREEAESRLARALENNGALARSNLRLQEQLARLRGEADVQQHEAGCLRAAAAAREAEAAARLARLQVALARAAAEREALVRQLAGKQQVVAYLEGRLAAAGRQAADAGCAVGGQATSRREAATAVSAAGVAPDAAACCAATAEDWQAEEESSLVSADSVAVVGGAAGAGEQEEVEQARAPCEEQQASASSPAAAPQLGRTASDSPSVYASPASALGPPEAEATPMQPAGRAPIEPATTALRSSLRPRNAVSYAQPSLRAKLRQGDPHTFAFGADLAAAPGSTAGGRPAGRARTKPRPRFAGGGAAALQED